jgi:hypothetical protein
VTGLSGQSDKIFEFNSKLHGKVHWFWMFQQVALCFEIIKWNWINLANEGAKILLFVYSLQDPRTDNL